MYLPETFAARRVCFLAGNVYWVRPLSVEGWATVIQWLDDFLPDEEQRETPPLLGDEASQAKLDTPAGRALLVWLALEESGVTFLQAAALSDEVKPEEYARLYMVIFGHRRTSRPSGAGGDISETWCGKGWAQMAVDLGMDAFGKLSLDQLEWLGSNGECDQHASPNARGYAQAMKMYEEAKAHQEANGMPVENN